MQGCAWGGRRERASWGQRLGLNFQSSARKVCQPTGSVPGPTVRINSRSMDPSQQTHDGATSIHAAPGWATRGEEGALPPTHPPSTATPALLAQVLAGAVVAQGELDAVITETGADTFFGKTIALLGQREEPGHLQQARALLHCCALRQRGVAPTAAAREALSETAPREASSHAAGLRFSRDAASVNNTHHWAFRRCCTAGAGPGGGLPGPCGRCGRAGHLHRHPLLRLGRGPGRAAVVCHPGLHHPHRHAGGCQAWVAASLQSAGRPACLLPLRSLLAMPSAAALLRAILGAAVRASVDLQLAFHPALSCQTSLCLQVVTAAVSGLAGHPWLYCPWHW